MHFILWTDWSHESTNFDTFKCSDENLPNSSCHFPNHKVSFSSNFAWLFIVIKDNSSVLFLVKCYILCTKRDKSQCKFWRIECSIKIHQILVIFERTNRFFFKFCITLSVSRNITPLYFFSWIFIHFQQKEPIKVYTNLVKFRQSSRKSEILHFDGLLL